MRPLLIFLVLGITAACQKPDAITSDPTTPNTLTGTWVEKSARQDTLIFNPIFAGQIRMDMLLVNRGKEVTGGFLGPKIGSGVIYTYELRSDRIYVQGGTSALAVYYANFSIRRKGDELFVDNFFEVSSTQPATATRTLVRL